MYLYYLSFLFILFSTHLYATVYENAEDKKVSRWTKLQSFTFPKIENIYDNEKRSRIIRFSGKGTRSSALLKTIKKSKKNEYLLSWEMKYSEDFVILLLLKTEHGKRYLIYTPGEHESYMQYALGAFATDGRWHKFSRNIEDDLVYYDKTNHLLHVDKFVIRGSGSIDNIQVTSCTLNKKRGKEKAKLFHDVSNRAPKIKILGANPFHLEIGEEYREPGVKGFDKEDGEIDVVTMDDSIDIMKTGEYSVIYIARDSDGNAAVDRRYVEVGDVTLNKTEERKPMIVKEDEKKRVQKIQDINLWEKELELREQALAQKEKKHYKIIKKE
jgi:hypothetical protein